MPHPNIPPGTGDLRIEITPTQDGTTIAFLFNEDLLGSLRATFPRARWNPVQRVWRLPGKRAQARAVSWAEQRRAEAHAARQAQQDAHRAAIEVQRAALRDNPIGTRSSPDRCLLNLPSLPGRSDEFTVQCGHSARATALVQAIPGAVRVRDTDTWTVPLLEADRLRAAFPEIEAGYAQAKAFRAAASRLFDVVPDVERVRKSSLVDARGNFLVVRFAYSEEAVAAIKTVPGARWRSAYRYWQVPLAEWVHLLAVLPRIEAEHERVNGTARQPGLEQENPA